MNPQEGVERWLAGSLSATEVALLRTSYVTIGSRSCDLATLMFSWHNSVRKIGSDVHLSDSDQQAWGVYDLIAALTDRDRIEDGLGRIASNLSRSAGDVIESADEELRSFTEIDEAHRIIQIDEAMGDRVEKGRNWWWYIIPIRGPIRLEIERATSRSE